MRVYIGIYTQYSFIIGKSITASHRLHLHIRDLPYIYIHYTHRANFTFETRQTRVCVCVCAGVVVWKKASWETAMIAAVYR